MSTLTQANRLARRFDVSPLRLDAIFDAAQERDMEALERALEDLVEDLPAPVSAPPPAPAPAPTAPRLDLVEVPEGADAVLSSIGDITDEGPAAVLALTKEGTQKLGGLLYTPLQIASHRSGALLTPLAQKVPNV